MSRCISASIVGLVLVGFAAGEQSAQRRVGDATVAEGAARLHENRGSLPPLLSAEVRRMAKVCGLPAEQRQTLQDKVQRALRPWDRALDGAALVKRMRPMLVALLKGFSTQTLGRWNSEVKRIEQRERRAAGMLQICMLDTALVFTSEQRRKLCEGIPKSAVVQPNAPRSIWRLSPSTVPLPEALSAGGLEESLLLRPQIEAVASPTQAVAFVQFQTRDIQRVQIVRRGFRHRLLNGPPVDDQRVRLMTLLDGHIDFVDAACDIDGNRRAKLLLAGRLDIESYVQRYRGIEVRSDDKSDMWIRLALLTDNSFAIFNQRDSRYQKFLRSRLDDDQQVKLAAAEAERLAFHKQALVEATVVGFQRSAALTADECEALADRFNGLLANCDGGLDQRSGWVHAIIEVAGREITSITDEEPPPPVQLQLAQLHVVTDFLEWQESPPR